MTALAPREIISLQSVGITAGVLFTGEDGVLWVKRPLCRWHLVKCSLLLVDT